MINWIMKKSGDIALKTDVGKLDLSRLPEDVTEIKDISYADTLILSTIREQNRT